MIASVQQMTDRVAELMESRLRVKGDGLAAKLDRGGRHLPRKVLAAAALLATSAQQSQSPKLQRRLDPEQIAEAYDTCVRYLKPLGAGARRWALIRAMGLSTVLILLVTAALVAAVLVWRGYL